MKYILNMFPYMIIGSAIYIIIRIILFIFKKLKFDWLSEITLFLFVIYSVGFASQTIIPKFDFGNVALSISGAKENRINLIPFSVFADTFNAVNNNNHIEYFLYNFIGNILLFIPFGFLLPLVFIKLIHF